MILFLQKGRESQSTSNRQSYLNELFENIRRPFVGVEERRKGDSSTIGM